MMKLKGYIGFHLQGQKEWFPKANIKMNKKVVDGERIIRVQNWLYDSKIKVDLNAL